MRDKKLNQEQGENTQVKTIFSNINILSDIYQIVSFDQEHTFSSKKALFGLIEDDSSYRAMGYLPRYVIGELIDNMRNHGFFDDQKESSIGWKLEDNIVYIKTINYMKETIDHGGVINSIQGFIEYLQTINDSHSSVLNALYIKGQQAGLNGPTAPLLNENSGAGLGFLDIGRKIKEKRVFLGNVFEYRFSSEEESNDGQRLIKFELLTKVPVNLPV